MNIPFLFFDMDGVLADWEQGMADFEGVPKSVIVNRDPKLSDPGIEEMVRMGYEKEFFTKLPILSGGVKLLNWAYKNNIKFGILSKPYKDDGFKGSVEGKELWLEKHGITDVPWIFKRDKTTYAVTFGTKNVLVDDFLKNIKPWVNAGGIGILHSNETADRTIAKLTEIYGK